VDAARSCDWILIAPGVYREQVLVRTPDLHLRGLDRNRVVIDGGHSPGNGIRVAADNVSVENLTVRDFDRRFPNDDATGNEILWNGVHGWRGSYLTTFDTGLEGGYGLYARASTNGDWEHVYASGFDDAGLYVGACRDCRATITEAVAERNALGFSGSNSSGHLILEDSLFRDNTIGVALDSTQSDPPPPQLGTCNAGSNRNPTPRITTTTVQRCTIVRGNRFTANDNLTAPSNTASARPGWGIGIVLLGTYGDLLADNVLGGNRNAGILALEFPYTQSKRSPAIRFQLAGNSLVANTISDSALGILLEGGLYGSRRSLNNCVAGNRYPTSLPADLARFDCRYASTPNPDAATSRRILSLVTDWHSRVAHMQPVAQPAPPAQPTMPQPCRRVPTNPVCPTH
jgi:hypothetical protein